MSDDTLLDGEAGTDVPVFTPEQQQYVSKMFDEQTQKLTSHFGRIVAQQFEEKVMPKVKSVDPDKLNEELSNRLFGGDVTGTILKVVEERERNKTELENKKIEAIQSELVKYKDQPLYKEIYADAENLAKEAVKKGYPPGPAAELAVEKARSSFLLNKDPEHRLNMSGGGKPTPRTKAVELPADLKTAAQRDIADGIFKDEADYIKNLSPSTRARYGL